MYISYHILSICQFTVTVLGKCWLKNIFLLCFIHASKRHLSMLCFTVLSSIFIQFRDMPNLVTGQLDFSFILILSTYLIYNPYQINNSCPYCFKVIFQFSSAVTFSFILFHVLIHSPCLFVSCNFALNKILVASKAQVPNQFDIVFKQFPEMKQTSKEKLAEVGFEKFVELNYICSHSNWCIFNMVIFVTSSQWHILRIVLLH